MTLTYRMIFLAALIFLSACEPIINEVKRIKDIPLGTGHSAHDLCSRLFISEQDKALIIEDVLVQKVFPLQWVWNIEINPEEKWVSVGAPFFNGLNNALAIYREGQGCTLNLGESVEALKEDAITPAVLTNAPKDDANRTEGELGVQPGISNENHAAIEALIDGMFEEFSDDRFEQINTYAVLVIHEGELIAERYSPEHDKDKRLIGWSISKSITALLMGILQGQGKLDLDTQLDLQHTSSKPLTLRHAFNMASGLDFDEGYETQSDIAKMLYVHADASAYARSRPFKHEPGSEFYYSTGDTQILSDFVQKTVGGTAQAAHDFYQTQLFHKLGIANAVVEHDAAGTFIGGARMFMRPRDWAKIGQLMLNKGKWQGETIVPEAWIDEMLEPSPANPYYGGQVWLYDPEVFGEAFPEDGYALWGVLGQLVVVVPSENLVVVRMGANGSGLPEDIESRTVFKPTLDMIRALSEAN